MEERKKVTEIRVMYDDDLFGVASVPSDSLPSFISFNAKISLLRLLMDSSVIVGSFSNISVFSDNNS